MWKATNTCKMHDREGILPEDIQSPRWVTQQDCHHFVHKTCPCTGEVHDLQPFGTTLNCGPQIARISLPPHLHSKLFWSYTFLAKCEYLSVTSNASFFPQLEDKQIKPESKYSLKKRKSYITRFLTDKQFICLKKEY